MAARHLKLEGFSKLVLGGSVLSILLFKVADLLVKLFELVLAVLDLLQSLLDGVMRLCAVVLKLRQDLFLICGFQVVKIDVILVVSYLILKLTYVCFLINQLRTQLV